MPKSSSECNARTLYQGEKVKLLGKFAVLVQKAVLQEHVESIAISARDVGKQQLMGWGHADQVLPDI